MATAGPNFPTAATGSTNTIGGGTVAWTNPTNIEANDGAVASCLPGVAITDDLRGGTFGFSIPTGATIKGILLEVNGSAFVGGIEAFHTVVLEGGGGASANRAAGALGSTASTFSFGGSSDLWGTTWTPAQINAGGFVANITFQSTGGGPGTVSVDWMRVTITYGTDASVSLTGQSLTSAGGTLSGAPSAILTGKSLTATQGTFSLSGTAVRALTGASLSATPGTLVGAPSANLVGSSITASQGSFSVSGSGVVSLTGVALTLTKGTFSTSGSGNVSLTGTSLTAVNGTLVPSVQAILNGVALTSAQGAFTGTGSGNVTLSGLTLTVGKGVFSGAVATSPLSGLNITATRGVFSGSVGAKLIGAQLVISQGVLGEEVRDRLPVIIWIF